MGDYLTCIAPVDAVVINFGVKNRVVALWISRFEAIVKKAQNGPSTQLIEATSCIEWSNATINSLTAMDGHDRPLFYELL